MTPEEATALRAPFPANAIGQLPKPTRKDAEKGRCPECHGWHGLPAVHLDYVGHAAATDRLLTVDPSWTWEPFALTDAGLPALDRDGNLWIRLTVCGVTRPGVGDGASMKERIGDAIRNAAMRFGVALDLWAKEDLHDSQQQATATDGTQTGCPAGRSDRHQCDCNPPEVDRLNRQADEALTRKPSQALTRKAMALFTELGMAERDARLEYTGSTLKREVGSWNDVTADEAKMVVDALERLKTRRAGKA